MGRQRVNLILDALSDELAVEKVILQRTSDARQELAQAFERYGAVRQAWETGDHWDLPHIDVDGVELSIGELVTAARVAEFTLRRTTEGLDSPRPTAVDAIRLSRRVSACLDAVIRAGGASLPKKLHPFVLALADTSFELSRCIAAYLMSHPAPDLTAGRDEPDAWQDLAGTTTVRESLVTQTCDAHRAILSLRPMTDDEMQSRSHGSYYAQRVVAAFSSATAVVPRSNLTPYVTERGWFTPDELLQAQTVVAWALSQNAELASNAAVASTLLIEGDHDAEATIPTLAAATRGLDGRNRMSVLCAMLDMASEPSVVDFLLSSMLDATPMDTSIDAARVRAAYQLRMCLDLGRLAVQVPQRATALARRLACWPPAFSINHSHVWLIPSLPPVALIEQPDGTARPVELPELGDFSLLENLSNNFAEEFDVSHDPAPLRRQLNIATSPLRTALADLTSPVTYYGFGFLKNVPLSALTGRGRILAVEPGVRLFSGGRASSSSRASSRLLAVDDELRQSGRLSVSASSEFRLNSTRGADPDVGKDLVSAISSADVAELIYFGHGHVDPHRFNYSGFIIGHEGDRPLIVTASWFGSLDLRHMRLALIMACGAGQGNVFVEPSFGLGQAFRAAGVETVIAPQWPILADHGLDFVNRFAARVSRGDSYATAWGQVLSQDPNRFLSIALLSA